MGGKNLTHHASSQLAIVGLLSQKGVKSYAEFNKFSFSGGVNPEICKIIRGDITEETTQELHRLVCKEASELVRREPDIQLLAYATPALDILTPEEANELGLESVSLNSMLANYCLNCDIKSVGILGTRWDMSEEGPLVKRLRAAGIEVFVLNDPLDCSMMSGCVISALEALVYSNGTPMSGHAFCFKAAQQLLQLSANTLERIIICNPELRSSMPLIRSELRKSQHTLDLIDASFLYWRLLESRLEIRAISQRFKNSPS